MRATKTPRKRYVLAALGALVASFFLNWAVAPLLYLPDPDIYYDGEMPDDVRGQLDYFYWVWDDPERCRAVHEAMSDKNPEWDLISRTFFGYSLANIALQYPAEKDRALEYLDRVIEDSVTRDWRCYLLPYGFVRPFVHQPPSSIMVDGEFALLIGLRRLVSDEPDYPYRKLHREMIERCVAAMEAGPVLCGESYPDECWLWCNPLALAAIRVYDILEGTDHSDLIQRWERSARAHLIDPATGLMKSAVTLEGEVIQPPEGSTIWIGAYCLLPVLPELAREQYALIKDQLAGDFLFVSFGREWPRRSAGQWDIDSGFTPFGLGPASTGFALVASKQMDDREFFARLLALLDIVGVPRSEDGRLRYLSSNFVGDATFLLAKTTGPAWEEVDRRWRERSGTP